MDLNTCELELVYRSICRENISIRSKGNAILANTVGYGGKTGVCVGKYSELRGKYSGIFGKYGGNLKKYSGPSGKYSGI